MERYEQGLISPGQIDSLLKLRLVLLFAEYPWLRMSSATAQQRLRESPWAIAEALDELAHAGLLSKTEYGGQPMYRLTATPEHRLRLERLARSFDDPQRRDELYDLVRTASEERRYREIVMPHTGALTASEFDAFVV
ncbi:hypothetical protein [Roseiflexus castenholzii]|jgi:hypothetical protein|uniref:Uncharacterized protein n=1 Tax=Roseiflexus castenholzii (strain DSM 13941 / HLO8) TaxID=383372 RepID=A7NR88_ROSCS|nr:hypothetical protein [Roseiflexus castenholzii]ABU60084.1 conserved hypothetical protein [Roseiflexus castenholzii DSM 13941]